MGGDARQVECEWTWATDSIIIRVVAGMGKHTGKACLVINELGVFGGENMRPYGARSEKEYEYWLQAAAG